MIFNLLNEELENKKLDKFYNQFYAGKLDEDTFLKLVELDVSSYQGNNPSNPIVNVGQLASAFILPDYQHNKQYIDSNLDRIKEATNKFINHRNDFDIKNPKAFTTTEQFVEYVLNGVKPVDSQNTSMDNKPKPNKKEMTADEKLAQLRDNQMPNIKDLNVFKTIVNLDVESNIESGQVGEVARALLLPLYNKSLSANADMIEENQDFLNQKKRTKIAIINYYEKKDKKLNNFKSVQEFLDEYAPIGTNVDKVNIVKVLRNFLSEGTDFEILGATDQHVIIWEKTVSAAYACDYYLVTIDEYNNAIRNNGWRIEKNPIYTYGRHKDPRTDNTHPNNRWCTGWPDSYFSTYTSGSERLYAIIQISGDVTDPRNNFQISIDANGRIHDAENGINDHSGLENTWRQISSVIFRKDPEIFQKLYSIDRFANCDRMRNYAINNDLKAKKLTLGNNYLELEPFIYHNSKDIQEYIAAHDGDKSCLEDIDNLIIADGVTEIPSFEFEGWNGLLEISFPNSLRKIGAKAFTRCESLPRIKKFNDGLVEIGMGAFEGCNKLSGSILLPDSIEKLGTYSFKDCKVKFRLKTSVLNIPNKHILVPTYPEDEKNWWRSNGRITIAD